MNMSIRGHIISLSSFMKKQDKDKEEIIWSEIENIEKDQDLNMKYWKQKYGTFKFKEKENG
jgi:hypothetical protein